MDKNPNDSWPEDNRSSTVNETSYIDEDIPYSTRPETYLVPIIFLIIFVVGVVGNGTLIWIFMRQKPMRNAPNTYILSLSIADLLVISTSLPFTSIIYTTESWPWGDIICKLSEFVKDVSIGVSVFSLTALSADRFFAIVNPFKRMTKNSRFRCCPGMPIYIAIGIWILAILCALPSLLASHVKGIPEENSKFHVCYPFKQWLNNTYPQIMVASKFLFLYVIPLIVIAVFYLSMAISLFVSTKNVPGEIHGMEKQIKARKKVAVTVLVFVAVFAISFAPLHAFMLFFYFYPNSEEHYNAFWHYLRIVGFCLCYINSCANPIALYFVSANFRRHFNRYLLCRNHEADMHSSPRQRLTSMSMTVMSTRRKRSSKKQGSNPPSSIQQSPPVNIQETSLTLAGVKMSNQVTTI